MTCSPGMNVGLPNGPPNVGCRFVRMPQNRTGGNGEKWSQAVISQELNEDSSMVEMYQCSISRQAGCSRQAGRWQAGGNGTGRQQVVVPLHLVLPMVIPINTQVKQEENAMNNGGLKHTQHSRTKVTVIYPQRYGIQVAAYSSGTHGGRHLGNLAGR